MVDGQNELNLEQGVPADTPGAPAAGPIADTDHGGAVERAAPDTGDPAKLQPDAVVAAVRNLDFSTVPPDVLGIVVAPIAKMIGDRVDATLGPACSELNGVATATLQSMKTAA